MSNMFIQFKEEPKTIDLFQQKYIEWMKLSLNKGETVQR